VVSWPSENARVIRGTLRLCPSRGATNPCNGSTPDTACQHVYKGVHAVPQALSVSTCQRTTCHTSCGTHLWGSAPQRILGFEPVVSSVDIATLSLIAASFSLGQVVIHSAFLHTEGLGDFQHGESSLPQGSCARRCRLRRTLPTSSVHPALFGDCTACRLA